MTSPSARDKYLKRKYGISLAEYEHMVEQQGGKCKICGRHTTELAKPLCVDHEHKSKKIRGLLCVRCNWYLGVIKENKSFMLGAIKYLEEVEYERYKSPNK